MASRTGRNWRAFGWGVALGLAVLTGWAWYDGGIREVAPVSVPAQLPGARR